MTFERAEYAGPQTRKIIEEMVPGAKAYAMIRMYKPSDPEKYPALRDRTEDYSIAVKALAGSDDVVIKDFMGRDLHEMGFNIVGAAFVQEFRFIAA